jgi:hypothetical protein
MQLDGVPPPAHGSYAHLPGRSHARLCVAGQRHSRHCKHSTAHVQWDARAPVGLRGLQLLELLADEDVVDSLVCVQQPQLRLVAGVAQDLLHHLHRRAVVTHAIAAPMALQVALMVGKAGALIEVRSALADQRLSPAHGIK